MVDLNVTKEEVDSLKKEIKKAVESGVNLKKIEQDLNKKYSSAFVSFLLRDFSKKIKKRKSDLEWVKEYREKVEAEKESKAFEQMFSISLTSLVIAIGGFFIIRQFKSLQESMDLGGTFGSIVSGFRMVTLVCFIVFILTFFFAVYRRYRTYRMNKQRFLEKKYGGKSSKEKSKKETKVEKVEEEKQEDNAEEKKSKRATVDLSEAKADESNKIPKPSNLNNKMSYIKHSWEELWHPKAKKARKK